jgi:HSP20 family protein
MAQSLWGIDRTMVVPMQVDPERIKAEYNEGLIALFIPRAEQEKPKTIQIS